MLVVPSNRPDKLDQFLCNWKTDPEQTIVIEDAPEKSRLQRHVRHHYSHAEIQADLKDKAWIISRGDGAVRCYGFLKAYQVGAEYIFTLDDDCLPIGSNPADFFIAHHAKMCKTPVWAETVMGLRTRGLPYKNKGMLKNVVCSVGLWKDVPDFDAVQSLSIMAAAQTEPQAYFEPPDSDRLLPYGQFFPISSMNLAFRREIAVLAYFPLSGEGTPFRRFDDIWWGVIVKHICDHLRLNIAVGKPYVCHSRASDPFVNLVKEAPGIAANEWFWEMIAGIKFTSHVPKVCMVEVGEYLRHYSYNDHVKHMDYVRRLGEAMVTWTELFDG